MQFLTDTLMTRPTLAIGLGAFLSGVALLYIVIQRTRKRRMEQSGTAEL